MDAVNYIDKTANSDGFFDIKKNNQINDLDSLTEEQINKLRLNELANPLYRKGNISDTFVDGLTDRSKYDKDINWIENAYASNDIGDIRANAQGGLGRLKDATINNLTILGTTMLSSSVGLVGGVISAGIHGAMGDENSFSKIWDNDFNNVMNDIQKGVMNNNQIYKGKTYEDLSFLGKATSGIFWAELWQNAGYMEGMIIPGMAIGSAAKALQISSKFPFLTKVATNLIAASGEASLEAINQRDESLQKLKQQNMSIYKNRLQNAVTEQDYLDALREYSENDELINQDVIAQGNRTFGGNIAVLTLTGSLEFGDFVSRGYAESHKLLSRIARNSLGKATSRGVVGDVAIGTGLFLKNSFLEGAEEYLQRGVASGSSNTLKANSFLEKYQDELDIELADNYLQAVCQAWTDDFNNPDAWLEFLSGALLGGIGIPGSHNGIIASVRDKVKEGKHRRELANEINSLESKLGINPNNLNQNGNLQEKIDFLIREIGINKARNQALYDRDQKKFIDSRVENILNYAVMYDNIGEINDFKERLQQYSSIDNEEQLKKIIEDTTEYSEDKKNVLNESPFKGKSISEANKLLKESYDFYIKIIDDFIKGKEVIDNYTRGKIDTKTLIRGAINYAQAEDWEKRSKELYDIVKRNLPKYKYNFEKLKNDNVNRIISQIENLNDDTFLGYFANPFSVNNNRILVSASLESLNKNADVKMYDEFIIPLFDLSRNAENLFYARKDFISILNNNEKESTKTQQILSKFKEKKKKHLVEKYAERLSSIKSLDELRRIINTVPIEYRNDVLTKLGNYNSELYEIVKNYLDINYDTRAWNNVLFYYKNGVYDLELQKVYKEYGQDNVDDLIEEISNLVNQNYSFNEIKNIINEEFDKREKEINSLNDETQKKLLLDSIKKKKDFFNKLSSEHTKKKTKIKESEKKETDKKNKKNTEKKDNKNGNETENNDEENGEKKLTKTDKKIISILGDESGIYLELPNANRISIKKKFKNGLDDLNDYKDILNSSLKSESVAGSSDKLELSEDAEKTIKNTIYVIDKLIEYLNKGGKETEENAKEKIIALLREINSKIKNKDISNANNIIKELTDILNNKEYDELITEIGTTKKDILKSIDEYTKIVKDKTKEKTKANDDILEKELKEKNYMHDIVDTLEKMSIERLNKLIADDFSIIKDKIKNKETFKKIIEKIIELKKSNNVNDDTLDAFEKIESGFYENNSERNMMQSMAVSKYSYSNPAKLYDELTDELSKAIQKIVDYYNGYDFVDSGEFAKELDELEDNERNTFIKYVRTVVEIENENGEIEKQPIYLLAIEFENGSLKIDGKNYQIVGSLARMTKDESKNEKSAESYKRITELLDKEFGSIENQKENTFVVSKKYFNGVSKINAGRPVFSGEEKNLEDVLSRYNLKEDDFEIGFYDNDNLILAEKVLNNKKKIIVKPNEYNMHERNGSVYIFIKCADGRYYPRFLRVKRFSRGSLLFYNKTLIPEESLFDKSELKRIKKGEYEIDTINEEFIDKIFNSLKVIANPKVPLEEKLYHKYLISTLLAFGKDENNYPIVPININLEQEEGEIYSVNITGNAKNDIISDKEEDIEKIAVDLLKQLSDLNLRVNIGFGYNNKNYDSTKETIISNNLVTTNMVLPRSVNSNFEIYTVDEDGKINNNGKTEIEVHKHGNRDLPESVDKKTEIPNIPSFAGTDFEGGIVFQNNKIKINGKEIKNKSSQLYKNAMIIVNLYNRENVNKRYLVYDGGNNKPKYYKLIGGEYGVLVKGGVGIETITLVSGEEHKSKMIKFKEKAKKQYVNITLTSKNDKKSEDEKKEENKKRKRSLSKSKEKKNKTELNLGKTSEDMETFSNKENVDTLANIVIEEENKTGKRMDAKEIKKFLGLGNLLAAKIVLNRKNDIIDENNFGENDVDEENKTELNLTDEQKDFFENNQIFTDSNMNSNIKDFIIEITSELNKIGKVLTISNLVDFMNNKYNIDQIRTSWMNNKDNTIDTLKCIIL